MSFSYTCSGRLQEAPEQEQVMRALGSSDLRHMVTILHLYWHVGSLVSKVEKERLVRRMVIYHLHCLPDQFFKLEQLQMAISRFVSQSDQYYLDINSLAMIFIFSIPGVEVCGELSLAFIGGFAALVQIMARSHF